MQFVDDGTKGAVAVYENTNGVPMSDGKNLHMEIGPHDIASRIITVGSLSRAEKIATFFDLTAEVKTITSSRGFTTITGSFRGTAVSVVSIGMVRF
jgi:uridine phosphorylase